LRNVFELPLQPEKQKLLQLHSNIDDGKPSDFLNGPSYLVLPLLVRHGHAMVGLPSLPFGTEFLRIIKRTEFMLPLGMTRDAPGHWRKMFLPLIADRST
jgi:hypothetical protein